MTDVAATRPFLAQLTADQVRTVLATLGPDLAIFVKSGIHMDGATLCTLTTPTLVKKSAYKPLKAGGLERSMLAKEVRKLTNAMFEPNLRAMFAPPAPSYVPRPPGALTNPEWDTIDEAHCSEDGATGVVFVNTKNGGYVVKASDAPARELFATELALHLNIPAAKQCVVTRVARATIVRRLSELSGEAARAQHTNAQADKEMLAIHVKLWSVFNQRPWVTAIELVPGAGLLCGMAERTALSQLDAATEQGARRCRQIGELICLDAFLNNNDRVPVVHSNVGNGRNVMFSNGVEGDVVAIDQVVTCFTCALTRQQQTVQHAVETTTKEAEEAETGGAEEVGEAKEAKEAKEEALNTTTPKTPKTTTSSMADVTTQLYAEYVDRVERWLEQCLTYEHSNAKQKSFLRQQSIHQELGSRAAELVQELKATYGMSDRDAEAVCRTAGFEKGTAHMVAGHPLMLQYAQERGPRICSEGSLLAVRDFIVRQCGYDVGEGGVESIRQGVCCCARKIAAMTHEDLLALKESVGASVTNSELKDSSAVDWKLLVEDKVRSSFAHVPRCGCCF